MSVDFHTHILPCVDDGSQSPAQSLDMLRRCGQMGIQTVVLTPHFYPDRDHPEHFFPRRNAAAEILNAAAEAGLPELVLGAEVHYFPNMHTCEVLRRFAIGGGRYLLVEMPMCRWTDRMYRELELIREDLGLIPIIAHLDRYLTPFSVRRLLKRVAQLPVLVQVNGEFFLQRKTARLALRMLKRGQIHLLGSDCHNLTDRKPNLGPVRDLIRARLGDEPLKRIAYFEQRVLAGGGTNGE